MPIKSTGSAVRICSLDYLGAIHEWGKDSMPSKAFRTRSAVLVGQKVIQAYHTHSTSTSPLIEDEKVGIMYDSGVNEKKQITVPLYSIILCKTPFIDSLVSNKKHPHLFPPEAKKSTLCLPTRFH